MSESVDSVLTILRHRIDDRVRIETYFGEPDFVDCFAGLLNQAVMSLVVNALDAIESTERVGTVEISTGASGSHYEITVSDDGPGIPSRIRDRVIDPFFTTKAVGKGTGLGLSVAYSIVERHKGALTLRDRPGGGTVATIAFPLEGF
jgi:signal transduction histidine kinase